MASWVGGARAAVGLARLVAVHPAVAGGRGRAALRILGWQWGKRRGARRARVRVGPLQLFCYPGSAPGSAALYVGLPEWDDMQFVLRYLRAGEHFVDVGANIGSYTLLAAGCLEGVQVTAVEPDAAARAQLLENLDLNGVTSVTVVAAALGARVGSVAFTMGRDSLNRIATGSDREVVQVPMRTLDQLAGDRPATLVKIDVEGAELEVLRGAERTLAQNPPPAILFELNHSCEAFGSSPQAIGAFLAANGYRLFEFDAAAGALQPFVPDHYPERGNILALKDPPGALRRVREPRDLPLTRPPIEVSFTLER